LDDQGRILVAKNHDGFWEMPGGGWEFGEPFSTCLEREVEEELGSQVVNVDPQLLGVYRGHNRHGETVRIVARVTLKHYNFSPIDMATIHFLSREEFMTIDLTPVADEGMKDLADKIWSSNIV
jgi:8-oxo-dGTP pyrophosphatase MutT (NUDIX family)